MKQKTNLINSHKCENCGEPATVCQESAKVWVTKHHTLQDGEWVETHEAESERDFFKAHFYCEECA